MLRTIKKTSNRFAKQLAQEGTVRVVGGRYWVVFTPSATRRLGLKVGQRFRVKDVKTGSVTLEPVSRNGRMRP